MTEANFDYNRTADYQLCLRISAERFTFALYDPDGNPPFHTVDYPTDCRHSLTANLKTICKDNNPFVGHPYQSIHILLTGKPCIAVPAELFDEERAESFYYACMPKITNERVLCHVMTSNDIVLLYGIDRTFCQLLLEYFPGAHIQVSSVSVMEYLHKRSRTSKGHKLYAHFHARQMDVYAFDGENFLLHNAFRCTQSNDVLYYLLYIWQQLGFDQTKDELYLVGRIPEQEHTLKELQRFVAQVAIIHPMAEFKRAAYAKENLDFDLQTAFQNSQEQSITN